jgi:hypothetical protein
MLSSNLKVLALPYFIIIDVLVCVALFPHGKNLMHQMQMSLDAKSAILQTIPAPKLTEKRGLNVVELFTSEGCSSCPPADELLAKAQNHFGDNTIVLSYHVDYWDRLGWKDRFSKALFSDRQRNYAQRFNLESIYTPQAIVNGQTQFVGSDKNALWKSIEVAEQNADKAIKLSAAKQTGHLISFNYSYPDLTKSETIVLELVLKNAVTEVKRGENKGATLAHIHVVEDMVLSNKAEGDIQFNLSPNLSKDQYMIVSFVQDKKTFAISGATKMDLGLSL